MYPRMPSSWWFHPSKRTCPPLEWQLTPELRQAPLEDQTPFPWPAPGQEDPSEPVEDPRLWDRRGLANHLQG